VTRLRLLVALIVVGVVAAGAAWLTLRTDDPVTVNGAATVVPEYDVVIPAGSGARIDAGEQLDILPGELVVRVGESIRIVNHDDRGHVVGIFYVGAGETLIQTFTTAGELSGDCSVHPSGRFTLKVVAA
jgi:plastocyanin